VHNYTGELLHYNFDAQSFHTKKLTILQINLRFILAMFCQLAEDTAVNDHYYMNVRSVIMAAFYFNSQLCQHGQPLPNCVLLHCHRQLSELPELFFSTSTKMTSLKKLPVEMIGN